MIEINRELDNKLRISYFMKEIKSIFKNHYFIAWQDLDDAKKLNGLQIIKLRNELLNIFYEEIDQDEFMLLNSYLDNLTWIFKDYKSLNQTERIAKCKHAMKTKDNIIELIEDLVFKYGGLKIE